MVYPIETDTVCQQFFVRHMLIIKSLQNFPLNSMDYFFKCVILMAD